MKLWLSLGFMGEHELLTCTLAEEAAYVGNTSVALIFSWKVRETAHGRAARMAFLDEVARAQPETSAACARGKTARP